MIVLGVKKIRSTTQQTPLVKVWYVYLNPNERFAGITIGTSVTKAIDNFLMRCGFDNIVDYINAYPGKFKSTMERFTEFMDMRMLPNDLNDEYYIKTRPRYIVQRGYFWVVNAGDPGSLGINLCLDSMNGDDESRNYWIGVVYPTKKDISLCANFKNVNEKYLVYCTDWGEYPDEL